MGNIKTIIEEWSVKDLEDGSSLNISVMGCSELGNQSKPGVQVCFMGNTINYEPLAVETWAYKAKTGLTEYLLEDHSWTVHADQYVKNYLLLGAPLKIKIEVKTRGSKSVIKSYELPFDVNE